MDEHAKLRLAKPGCSLILCRLDAVGYRGDWKEGKKRDERRSLDESTAVPQLSAHMIEPNDTDATCRMSISPGSSCGEHH